MQQNLYLASIFTMFSESAIR